MCGIAGELAANAVVSGSAGEKEQELRPSCRLSVSVASRAKETCGAATCSRTPSKNIIGRTKKLSRLIDVDVDADMLSM